MHELKELETALKFIENKENYYAGFRHVMETCARADVINTALWNVSKINDAEKLMYSDRIRTAKNNAIKRHKAWLIRRMQESTGHTVESLISTVYSAIFN